MSRYDFPEIESMNGTELLAFVRKQQTDRRGFIRELLVEGRITGKIWSEVDESLTVEKCPERVTENGVGITTRFAQSHCWYTDDKAFLAESETGREMLANFETGEHPWRSRASAKAHKAAQKAGAAA